MSEQQLGRHLVRRVALHGLVGALVGVAVFGLDQLLTRMLAGFWVPTPLQYVGWYVILGAASAGLVLLAKGIPRRGFQPKPLEEPTWHTGLGATASWVSALLYVPAVLERLENAGIAAVGPRVGLSLAVVGLVAVGVWILVLRAVLGERHQSWAGVLTGLMLALGLLVNRTVVASPLAPKALAIDVSIVLGCVAVAMALRHLPGRVVVAACGMVLAVGGIAGFLRQDAEMEPHHALSHPHVVMLVVDTLRADVFDDVVRNTPEGVAFRQAFGEAGWFPNTVAAAPWTAPSMGSVMTGLYPREHGLVKPSKERDLAAFTHLADGIPTVAANLSSFGYQSMAVVANPVLHPQSGIARGFQHYEVLAGPTVKLPLLTALSRVRWVRPRFYQQAPQVSRGLKRSLALRDPARPLFLWLHWMDPHDPLVEHSMQPTEGESELSPVERLYRREVRFTLAEMTRSIELLRQRGIWERSVVLMFADHGEMFPSDLRDKVVYKKQYGHGHAMYDELVRVPLIVRPPDAVRSREFAQLVHHTDLHDTILDLARVPPVAVARIGRDRVSLAPRVAALTEPGPDGPAGALSGSELGARQFALIEATHSGPEQRAWRSLDWKMVDHLSEDISGELYDLRVDPLESHNLASEESATLLDLRQELTDFWNGLDPPPFTRDMVLDPATRKQLEALGYL